MRLVAAIELGRASVLEGLIGPDHPTDVRAKAIRALGGYRVQKVERVLVGFLRDSDEEVRRAAAEVLAAQGLLYGQAGGLTLADAEGGTLSLVDDSARGRASRGPLAEWQRRVS